MSTKQIHFQINNIIYDVMKSFENQLIITNIFLGFKQTMIHVIVISE